MKNESIEEIAAGPFFWGLSAVGIFLSFTKETLGLYFRTWHLILHLGIIMLCFMIIITILEMNLKSRGTIFFGLILLIISESVLFLTHLFAVSELEHGIFLLGGSILAFFILLEGVKQSSK